MIQSNRQDSAMTWCSIVLCTAAIRNCYDRYNRHKSQITNNALHKQKHMKMKVPILTVPPRSSIRALLVSTLNTLCAVTEMRTIRVVCWVETRKQFPPTNDSHTNAKDSFR